MLPAPGASGPIDSQQGKEVFLDRQNELFMAPVMDFVWWLIRAGLARPAIFANQALITLEMTPAGLSFLDSVGDHPLAPEFVERLRNRHPDIPEPVIVLLQDAQACLEA